MRLARINCGDPMSQDKWWGEPAHSENSESMNVMLQLSGGYGRVGEEGVDKYGSHEHHNEKCNKTRALGLTYVMSSQKEWRGIACPKSKVSSEVMDLPPPANSELPLQPVLDTPGPLF
ncbi:hypothetical protein BTUL_0135g00060 [Botrytis tulipae]|uniref:Uncharacterized protein n=1 Tax=Botrytis tulipae TaxID=87230 RepID=A0A4Z1EJ56_9HELO|nr:hypothetical protein BTUL_0135g00060 [Botrytis tulipae]